MNTDVITGLSELSLSLGNQGYAEYKMTVEDAAKEIELLRELVELQERLLFCCRVGKNPGTIIDKIRRIKTQLQRTGHGDA